MNCLQKLVAVVLLACTGSVAASYDISKTLTISDEFGGSLTQQASGTLDGEEGSFTAVSNFENFLIVDDTRAVTLNGELSAGFDGSRTAFLYSLNGQVDVAVDTNSYSVEFDAVTVSRQGLVFDISGTLLVNGNQYQVGQGSLAEKVIVAIVILQGQ